MNLKIRHIVLLALISFIADASHAVASTGSNVTAIISSGHLVLPVSNDTVYASSDTGRTWVFSGRVGYTRTTFRTTKGTFLIGEDRSLSRSEDGFHWAYIDSGLHAHGLGGDGVNGFTADRAGKIFAATGHGIYTSIDDGLSWQTSGLYDSVHITLDSSLSCIAMDSNGVFFAGHTDIGAYKSFDGRNWIALDSPMKFIAPTAIGVNSHNLIFAGHGRRIFVSSDDGVTWTQKTRGLLSTGINQILIDQSDNVYLAALGGVYVSRDAGENWGLFGKGLPDKWINEITLLPGGDMAAAGLHGVYFYSHVDSTWREIDHNWGAESKVEDRPKGIAPLMCYPNPASSLFTIEGLAEGEIDCAMFDVLGREVAHTKVSDSRIDIHSLQPGSYRVRCTQGNIIRRANLVVVR